MVRVTVSQRSVPGFNLSSRQLTTLLPAHSLYTRTPRSPRRLLGWSSGAIPSPPVRGLPSPRQGGPRFPVVPPARFLHSSPGRPPSSSHHRSLMSSNKRRPSSAPAQSARSSNSSTTRMLSSQTSAAPNGSSQPVHFSVLKFPDTHTRQANPDLPPVPTVVLEKDTCEIRKSDQHGQVAIKWHERPRAVLMLKKIHEPEVTARMREVGRWLQSEHGLQVFVEPAVHNREIGEFQPYFHKNPAVPVDFCICLGGDGTLLYLNSLFQGKTFAIPPIASFAFGSLGFLTPFKESEIESVVNEIMNSVDNPLFLTLRTRFEASIKRGGKVDATYQVLNEVTIGRGGNSQPAWMELFVGGKLVTSSQADGLIISTPTGSTAYSMSAGGSMVAPSVPAILITPICPHTLSFRPILVPDDTEVVVRVPKKRSRRLEEQHHLSNTPKSGASTIQQPMDISFDGRSRVTLKPGDQVSIKASPYPVPAVKLAADDNEWFHSIRSKLHWNLHLREKPDYGTDDDDVLDATPKPSKL